MDIAYDDQTKMSHDAPQHWAAELLAAVESWLESERERLPLLFPVGLGIGIACWQLNGDALALPLLASALGLLIVSFAVPGASRLAWLLRFGAFAILLGFAAISAKSSLVGAKPLDRPWTGEIAAKIVNVEDLTARQITRYELYVGVHPELPSLIRINVDNEGAAPTFDSGDIISAKVRLMPPPGPSLPGGYDFARTAWFTGIGATGRALGPIELRVSAPRAANFWNGARNDLSRNIIGAMGAETGAIGSALLVGTRGGIEEEDAEALRNSGMAHLLSVSGLHVTAVVGASFLIVSAFLASISWFALRVRVPLLAAAASAVVAVFYTLLTGAEVPTVRACIAALLILLALALGRNAISLRMLAAGAVFVLLFWPEALSGPSFQLSFAAVGTIVLLHENEHVRRWLGNRDQMFLMRGLRAVAGLLITGFAIEIVLAPIALYHFHKSGVYGALANIVAIPLTTFLIMPTQMLGLLADLIAEGLGAPFWWMASWGVTTILWLAHSVSSAPGAVALLPEMPTFAFATTILCGLTIAIFETKWRFLAIFPMAVSLMFMITSPRPDMLLTGDGQHLAVVLPDGKMALLRQRAGQYARSLLSETAAISEEDAIALDDMSGAICNEDGCSFALTRGGRNWKILALRSNYMIPVMELAAACRRSDIVISKRRLPWSCQPRWLKADAALLERTGGIAFYMERGRISYVAEENAHLPWSAYAPARLHDRVADRAKQKAARKNPPPLVTAKTDQ